MKRILFFLFFAFLFNSVFAQDVNILLKEAASLENSLDEQGAYGKYIEVLKINPNQVHALAKCSELCSRIGKREKLNSSRDAYYETARNFALKAISIDPNNSEANCSMAVALGRNTMSKSGKQKMEASREIKKYVDAAIRSDANNFLAWHVLGRWHYELSCLSFVERSAVKLFYGGLPPTSFKEAIIAFEKCQSITPEFVLNYVELAKAYHKDGQNDKAIATVKKMFTLTNRTEDDASLKEEGRKLLLILEKNK